VITCACSLSQCLPVKSSTTLSPECATPRGHRRAIHPDAIRLVFDGARAQQTPREARAAGQLVA
jgi:hypothetical protein